MLSIYRTEDSRISPVEKGEKGCWIKLTDPSDLECNEVSKGYNFDITDVRARKFDSLISAN